MAPSEIPRPQQPSGAVWQHRSYYAGMELYMMLWKRWITKILGTVIGKGEKNLTRLIILGGIWTRKICRQLRLSYFVTVYYIYLSFWSYHNNSFVWYIHYFSSVAKVVAYKYVKKHQTNTYNNRVTITIYCCGLASGVDGPRFYLVKAENIDIQTYKGNFAKKHKAHPGSVIPTPNSYMTNPGWALCFFAKSPL